MFYITISHVVSITSAVLCDFTGHSLRPMVTGFFLGDIRLCISLSIQLKQTHDTGFLGSWWWNIVRIWCYSKLFLYFKSKVSFLNWVSLHNTCLLIYLIVFMRMQRVKSGPRSALGVYYIWSLVNFLEQVRLWPCKFSWFNNFIQCWSMVKFCFLWRSALTPRLLSNPRTHWTVGRKGFFFISPSNGAHMLLSLFLQCNFIHERLDGNRLTPLFRFSHNENSVLMMRRKF